MLAGRRIILGITGGIAAYKAVEVCRRMVDAGAHVIPVMTDGAARFVGETTFSALASEPVQTSLWTERDPIPHTRLGQNADVVLVCPATARLIGSLAAGISDDLLTATLLATRAPVVICPAMHTEMWEHPAVVENIETISRRGAIVVPPDEGRLAGGDLGAGRLATPEKILAAVESALSREPGGLEGLNVLVTAGGTREAIDAVRVVTNRSSGKQGYALAEEAHSRGADVTLVTTVDRPISPGIQVINVSSAKDMEDVVVPMAARCDVVVMAAAVADFRPVRTFDRKIKKTEGITVIEMEPTHDFLVDLGHSKPPGQVLVGFAAETDDLVDNAVEKLDRKNLDLIVANDVSEPDVGFEFDTNAVVLIGANGFRREVALTDKRSVAREVFDAVVAIRGDHDQQSGPIVDR